MNIEPINRAIYDLDKILFDLHMALMAYPSNAEMASINKIYEAVVNARVEAINQRETYLSSEFTVLT